jgi:hypothetical protein
MTGTVTVARPADLKLSLETINVQPDSEHYSIYREDWSRWRS